MKRTRKLIILAGVLVGCCILTFCVTRYEEKKEEIQNSDEIILEVETEKVTALSWEYEKESFSFHKEENWIYDEDENFPVNEEKIEELLSLFQSFGVSFQIENVEDYAQYGLEDPEAVICLKTEEETYEIKVGNYSNMDSQRYVSIGDEKVYLVTEDPLETYEVALSDLIQNDEIPEMEQANCLVFSGAEDYEIIYDEECTDSYRKEDVYFAEVDGINTSMDTDRIEDYLQIFDTMTLGNYVTYHAAEEDLETYGLAEPDLMIQIHYVTGEEAGIFQMSIAKDPNQKEDLDEEEELLAYARINDSSIIYKISGDTYEELMQASPKELRHQNVFYATFGDLNKAEITLEDETYVITAKEEKDEIQYYCGKDKIEIADFQKELAGMKITRFTEAEPDGKEEIRILIKLDNEDHPKMELTFYRHDGEECLVCVNDEPYAYVSRSDVVDLVEAVNAIVLN